MLEVRLAGHFNHLNRTSSDNYQNQLSRVDYNQLTTIFTSKTGRRTEKSHFGRAREQTGPGGRSLGNRDLPAARFGCVENAHTADL